jgi:hypothetical protein
MKKYNQVKPLSPEWSHKIDADQIEGRPVHFKISPSPEQCKDLARRLQIEAIEHLEASLTAERDKRNMSVHVTGELSARVKQLCVVSREPVFDDIRTAVEGWFADPGTVISITKARHEKDSRSHDAELPILDERDDPEPYIDGKIDLGELAAQYLSLAVNPYPQKDDVDYKNYVVADDDERKIPELRRNPFAALKDWKKSD